MTVPKNIFYTNQSTFSSGFDIFSSSNCDACHERFWTFSLHQWLNWPRQRKNSWKVTTFPWSLFPSARIHLWPYWSTLLIKFSDRWHKELVSQNFPKQRLHRCIRPCPTIDTSNHSSKYCAAVDCLHIYHFHRLSFGHFETFGKDKVLSRENISCGSFNKLSRRARCFLFVRQFLSWPWLKLSVWRYRSRWSKHQSLQTSLE